MSKELQHIDDDRSDYEMVCKERALSNGRSYERHYFKRSSAGGNYLNPNAEHGWQIWQKALESQAREIERLEEHAKFLERAASNKAIGVLADAVGLKAQPSGVVLPDELTEEMRNSMAYVPGLSDTTMQDLLWLALKLARLNQPASAGDREALIYLMERFDNEVWVCPRCSHEEPTKDMDSASYLREYLAGAQPASAGDERAEFEVCGVTVKRNEVGDWEYLSEGYGNDPDIWVACSDILGRFGGGGVDELLTAYAELQARDTLSANHSEQVRVPEGLAAALFNALEVYKAKADIFEGRDRAIHSQQCEMIRQHAASLFAAAPSAGNQKDEV